MVICVKCGKEQGRRTWTQCEYNGNEHAGKEHAWADRGEFIDELREKLPPLIKERIAGWQNKHAEKQAAFSERLIPYTKRLDELQAAYTVYLNVGLPLDVKKKKQSAIRPFLPHLIGGVIGLGISFKIPGILGLEITPLSLILIIVVITVLLVYFLHEPVVEFLRDRRYAESQNFADELASAWQDNNGITAVKSNIEVEKDKWNDFSKSLNRCIHSAERALVGSDEELLNYYNTDKKAKNWYLENIYEGEW